MFRINLYRSLTLFLYLLFFFLIFLLFFSVFLFLWVRLYFAFNVIGSYAYLGSLESMAELRLASLNALNAQIHSQVLQYMHKQKVKILFLQKLHFRASASPAMPMGQYSTWFYSSDPDRKRGGVAIGIHRWLPFQLVKGRIIRHMFIC